jgi:hypothetical protein
MGKTSAPWTPESTEVNHHGPWGLARHVISVKIPLVFPPGDMPLSAPSGQHWFIVHREDAAKVLLLKQQVQDQTQRYLETAYGRSRLRARYDWDSVVMDANARCYTLDLSDSVEKSADVLRLFEKAAENTPALVILEDLDRAFPTEGKRTQERTVSFQTLLNCLDGVGSQDGVIVVATANDPTCLDAAILKRPGRFDRVVQFRNPNAELRREYYQRLSPVLTGDQFEIAIEQTEGFSFAQLRETYILGAQSAFEHGSEVMVADVIEAIELQTVGAQDLKTSVSATGFVSNAERTALR